MGKITIDHAKRRLGFTNQFAGEGICEYKDNTIPIKATSFIFDVSLLINRRTFNKIGQPEYVKITIEWDESDLVHVKP
ncbi:MAG: hypothetical protein M1306_00625 [Candidatus Thermoplasmatota archaeon]|jgi:hypothetical protein|nr:hypothetical protein [Candidatus Thermoplasmatota archaeon]